MKRLFIYLGMAMVVATGLCSEPPHQLDKAKALPLALDDHFQFRKIKLFLNDPKYFIFTTDPMVLFERERMNYGAVDNVDKTRRQGNYFSFFWRSDVKSDVTVRLEYRQENLGSYVQAREVSYTGAKGTTKTDFQSGGR